MARFTQYIGLSPASHDFLSKNEHKIIGKWVMTFGIAQEEVYGNIYEVKVKYGRKEYEYSIQTYVEYEDVCPWSSGPMIHTALMHIPSGQKNYKWEEEEIHYD